MAGITLRVLPQALAVCRVASFAGVALDRAPLFLANTGDELSVVCAEAAVPAGTLAVEAGWRGLRVAGALDFSLLGIIAGISAALAEAGVSVFVVSTYDTDYVLVKADRLEDAIAALRARGYAVEMEEEGK